MVGRIAEDSRHKAAIVRNQNLSDLAATGSVPPSIPGDPYTGRIKAVSTAHCRRSADAAGPRGAWYAGGERTGAVTDGLS